MGTGVKSKYSKEQNESLILKVLNHTLKLVDDPVLKHVSFTYVRLSGDKSYLKVYVDTFNRDRLPKILRALDNASGLFKNELAHQTHFYKVPKISFVADETIDKSLKIENLLSKIKGVK